MQTIRPERNCSQFVVIHLSNFRTVIFPTVPLPLYASFSEFPLFSSVHSHSACDLHRLQPSRVFFLLSLSCALYSNEISTAFKLFSLQLHVPAFKRQLVRTFKTNTNTFRFHHSVFSFYHTYHQFSTQHSSCVSVTHI